MIPQANAAIVAGVVGLVAFFLGRSFGVFAERDKWLEAHRNGNLLIHAATTSAYMHDRFFPPV